jgi:hypothetical protein
MVVEGSRQVAWVGDTAAAELAWARAAVLGLAQVRDLPRPEAWTAARQPATFEIRSPAVVILASDWPGRFTLRTVVEIARRWPLAVIVSVATCLAEGRRRSGPPLPGVEEVPWNDLPARMAWWFAELDAGRPGPLGLPGTVRREDRLDAVARSTRRRREASCGGEAGSPSRPRVVVAAARPEDLDGTAAAVAAAGGEVVRQIQGLPSLDDEADAWVLEPDRPAGDHLAWLRRFTAARPRCRALLLESFPRHESVVAAMACGASAVLSRPVSLEALAGGLWGPRPGAAAGAGRS